METFYVVENKRTGFYLRKSLGRSPCNEVSGKKLAVQKECLQFEEDVDIGGDRMQGTKKYLEVKLSPCVVDCAIETSDPLYSATVEEFFYYYGFYIGFMDSTSDYSNYSSPISQIFSADLEVTID